MCRHHRSRYESELGGGIPHSRTRGAAAVLPGGRGDPARRERTSRRRDLRCQAVVRGPLRAHRRPLDRPRHRRGEGPGPPRVGARRPGVEQSRIRGVPAGHDRGRGTGDGRSGRFAAHRDRSARPAQSIGTPRGGNDRAGAARATALGAGHRDHIRERPGVGERLRVLRQGGGGCRLPDDRGGPCPGCDRDGSRRHHRDRRTHGTPLAGGQVGRHRHNDRPGGPGSSRRHREDRVGCPGRGADPGRRARTGRPLRYWKSVDRTAG